MAKKLTGGCHCGAVRYEISAEPLFSGNCYCEDCRKVGGTGHSSVFAVPEPAVSVKGKLTEYQIKGGSGQPITRRFCPKCGSRVTATASVMPGVLMVTASSLDDPESFVLQMSIYAAQAPSWDQPPTSSPVFPGMPPQN
jgi:hypothetical protein